MDKGTHCAWGLELAQEADVGTRREERQARFRDRACYSRCPGLSGGLREGSVSKWEREVGLLAG